MKKTILIVGVSALILSCNQATKSEQESQSTTESKVEISEPELQESTTDAEFNIEDLPFSTADIGDFPFINLPDGLEPLNKPLEQKFDVCFFPIQGVMTPFEGRLYKVNVTHSPGESFSQRYFEKSMEEYLNSVGAVKVFEGDITSEEYYRYHKQDPNKGDEGDIGFGSGEMIRFFIIRSKEKGNIYVQYVSNNAGGKLNVLQEQGFKQTITKVTADEIVNDLHQQGKSILYIHFDVDKADITTQAMETVSQISKALQKDHTLSIGIQGHTDNTGDSKKNKVLSDARAVAVMNYLIANGVDSKRLTAKGFGSDVPLVGNDTEENRAKNRRVELVKN